MVLLSSGEYMKLLCGVMRHNRGNSAIVKRVARSISVKQVSLNR